MNDNTQYRCEPPHLPAKQRRRHPRPKSGAIRQSRNQQQFHLGPSSFALRARLARFAGLFGPYHHRSVASAILSRHRNCLDWRAAVNVTAEIRHSSYWGNLEPLRRPAQPALETLPDAIDAERPRVTPAAVAGRRNQRPSCVNEIAITT